MAAPSQEMSPARSITSIVLESQPSCIEFCPLFKQIFVVGAYKLEEESDASEKGAEGDAAASLGQVRSGTLTVFRLEADLRVTRLQTVDIDAGVLDLHFSPRAPDVLAVALSDGRVQLKRLTSSHHPPQLSDIWSERLSEGLILAVAWDPAATQAHRLTLTTSTGSFATLIFSEDWSPMYGDLQFHEAHALEAWTLAWPAIRSNPEGQESTVNSTGCHLYTGGDDGVLCQWDLSLLTYPEDNAAERLPADAAFEKYLVQRGVEAQVGLQADRRTHGAGVTAILPLPVVHTNGSEIVITGSYDEHVRVLSKTGGTRWRTLAEERLYGGVWRLKEIESVKVSPEASSWTVLASCMHAGCKILSISRDVTGSWSIQSLASFEEHKSMNYASEITADPPVGDGPGHHVVVSTSFFDKRLCVWKFPRPADSQDR